jgi:hypothetical protein
MDHGSPSDLVVALGPVFGFLFFALVVAVMVALLAVGAWGLVKGTSNPRIREPEPV